MIRVKEFIAQWPQTPFHHGDDTTPPWAITNTAPALIRKAIPKLDSGYRVTQDIAIHSAAKVEDNVVLKGPIIISPGAFVASGAYLRGGVYLGRNAIIGPACEVKTVFMMNDAKIAHLSFVGDAIVGAKANIEAGAIVANYRNEYDGAPIRITRGRDIIETGTDKFGALIGDNARIGANAVIAPGALIDPNTKIDRLSLVDQWPDD